MKNKILFLAWQDQDPKSRRWFPVGRLDSSAEDGYQFQYVQGAHQAHQECGFEPLYDFPEFLRVYRSTDLFPMFKNRVLTPARRDFQEYLRVLDLSGTPDPIEILSVDGGYRATDTFEVFPKIERHEDGTFQCRFFLHGWRHLGDDVPRRIALLKPGEPLSVALELTNPTTRFAMQIQTKDYVMIGWAPRYLASDLTRALAGTTGEYGAYVVQVNTAPAPSKQRLLVELHGSWPDIEPMSTGPYEPLVVCQSSKDRNDQAATPLSR